MGLIAEMDGLVSVLVSVPVRPKMSGLEKVSVSRDFILKVSVSVSISWDLK